MVHEKPPLTRAAKDRRRRRKRKKRRVEDGNEVEELPLMEIIMRNEWTA